jgi:glycine/D-amino acid oxidase-like deaminating enzyme
LHAELAKEHDGAKRWGYRAVHCGSVQAKGKVPAVAQKNEAATTEGVEEWKKLPKTSIKMKSVSAELPDDLDWLDTDSVRSYSEMGTPATTAQVHPKLFTTTIAELAAEKGAQIILGSVTAIDRSAKGVKGVAYMDKATKESHTIPATDVIVAAGPWTNTILPEAPIEAMRAHSVVIKADVSPYAIFTDIELPKNYAASRKDVKKRKHGKSVNPEMYARPDGTVYACGKFCPHISISRGY